MSPVRRLCLIALFCLSGCAETKYRGDAMPPIAADQARIVFFRNTSFVGADLQAGILYDGKQVGISRQGTYFYIDTTPGTHDISTTGDLNNHFGVTLAPGETRYIKTGLGLGQSAGRIEPETVSAERALRDLPELTFTPSGPTYVAGKPEVPPPQPSCGAAGAASCPAAVDNTPVNEADPTPQPMPQPMPAPVPVQTAPVQSSAASEKMPEKAPDPEGDKPREFQLGPSSNTVEDLARREKQCEPVRGAGLISSDGPIEYYREQCKDGRVFRAKCQFHQCVEIDSN